MFPSVMRTLRTEMGRAVLLAKLREHTLGQQATMENAQFEMLGTLLNAVLAADSRCSAAALLAAHAHNSPERQRERDRDDELGIAAALIPLASSFCRVRHSPSSYIRYDTIRYDSIHTSCVSYTSLPVFTVFCIDIVHSVIQFSPILFCVLHGSRIVHVIHCPLIIRFQLF